MKFRNILIIVLFLLTACTNDRNYNRIGILYSSKNLYYDTSLKNKLLDWKFNNNYYVKIYKLYKNNIKNIKEEIIKNKIGKLIMESDNKEMNSELFEFCEDNNILLNLIANSTNNTFHKLFITDYKKSGYDIGNNLYALSRSKRDIVIVYFEKKYYKSYWKKELLKGFTEFNKKKNIIIYTNNYTGSINYDDIKIRLKKWISTYTNNLRGIFTDNESISIILLNLIRRLGKDGEIKIASYGATLDGINSMLKIGLAVTADENRLSLFTNALNYNKNLKKINFSKKIIYIPGIIYNQTILLENLSKSKKYSIKQIISEYKQ